MEQRITKLLFVLRTVPVGYRLLRTFAVTKTEYDKKYLSAGRFSLSATGVCTLLTILTIPIIILSRMVARLA